MVSLAAYVSLSDYHSAYEIAEYFSICGGVAIWQAKPSATVESLCPGIFRQEISCV